MTSTNTLKIAVEGCCHGELDNIYKTLDGKKIDLLIICGDFQAIRNSVDLETMSVPDKYKRLGGFHEYYSGLKVAPVLTLFIGGNHESSSYLKELKYGGWVAPNIYYLGEFGCVWFKGLQIGGISGIYNQRSFYDSIRRNNDDEKLPYNAHTIRSIYQVKAKNYLKMYLMDQQRLDIVLSHDWPQHIEKKGNLSKLLREKPFFKTDIKNGTLGSPLNNALLNRLKPRYWFSSHLHVRFEAVVKYTLKRANSVLSSCASKRSKSKAFNNEQNKEHNYEKIELDMDTNNYNESIQVDMDEENDEKKLVLDMEDGGKKQTISDNSKEGSNLNVKNEERIDFDMDDIDADKSKVTIPQASTGPVKENLETHFLALDKCLPRRKFLEILDITVPSNRAKHPSNLNSIDTGEVKAIFYHDKRAIAINKVIESFINSNLEVWNSIYHKDFYDFADKQTDLFNELSDMIQFEVAKLDKMSSELFQINPTSFKILAPTNNEGNIQLKYWENNQTTDYCSKFHIPYIKL